MARTPASVDIDTRKDGDHIVLSCDVCDATVFDSAPGEFASLAALVDAHDEHADKVHGEGV